MATELRPCVKLFIQFEGGYYAIAMDETVGLVIVPGSGCGVLTVGGRTYTVTSNIAGPDVAQSVQAQTDLLNTMSLPMVVATPKTFAQELVSSNKAMIDLAPGHYTGSYDFTVDAPPA